MNTSNEINEKLVRLEDEVAYLKGCIDTLTHVCELLVASHPKSAKFEEILAIKANAVATLEHPTTHLQSYAEGATRFGLGFSAEEVLTQIANDQFHIIAKRRNQ